MKAETLDAILNAIDSCSAVVLATNTGTGAQRLLHQGEGASDAERTIVQRALSGDICIDEEGVFYQPFNPPLRMVLVGAVHIAQPLSTMAALAGYEVTLVDPRESFGSADRFPGVSLDTRWPDAALDAMQLDHRCAIVTLTHDPKLDDPALRVALQSDAFFIGSLGSRKTHASRLQRLAKDGWDEEQLARIHGPVGLPIGSRTPGEIAIAVMAQVTAALRKSAS